MCCCVLSGYDANMFDPTRLFQITSAYSTPALIIVSAFIFGYLFERFIIGYIKKIAARTIWKTDDIVLKGIHGMPTIWFTIAGVYIAISNSSLLPENALRITKIILIILAILTATIVISRIVVLFIQGFAAKGRGKIPETSIIINIANLTVFIIGGLVVMQTLGISVTPILTAFGVGGLAVALALKDTLSNLFSGLQIILTKQIRVGDYIKLASEEEGYVTDINWRNTTIRMLNNNLVIVPNERIATSIMTNFSRPQEEMSISIEINVTHENDLEKVETITLEVAREVMQAHNKKTDDGIKEEPHIRFHTFAENRVHFVVVLRISEFADQYVLTHELIKALHSRYKQSGILKI